MKRILSIALLALFAQPILSQQIRAQTKNTAAQAKSRSPQTAAVETELKKLEREWFDAVVKGDAETLKRILADDFSALNADGTFINKSNMAEFPLAGMVKLDEIKTDEFNLRLYGNTAVVTGRATYFRDQKPLGQSSHVETWVKRPGGAGPSARPRWQAVSWVSMRIKASVLGAKAVTTGSGLKYEDIIVGTGPSPQPGQEITVHYTGTLEDGTKFDSSYDYGRPIPFQIGVGRVIKGWDEGVITMKIGGKRKLVIPPDLGYGPRCVANKIPPDATLVFEIELISVK